MREETGEILFGGQPEQGAPETPPNSSDLDELLGGIAEKYVIKEARFSNSGKVASKSEPDELLQQITHWAARVWVHNNELPQGKELQDFNILSLEDEYREYAKNFGLHIFDRGATIDEIWRSQQLLDRMPCVSILSEKHKRLHPRGTELCMTMSAEKLVWLFGVMLIELNQSVPLLSVLVSNGKRGHSIRLGNLVRIQYEHPRGKVVEPGWFSFHDPWPARSLLAPEGDYGISGVLEDVTRPPLWVIPPADLEEVIVGIVMPISLFQRQANWFSSMEMMDRARTYWEGPFWTEGAQDGKSAFSFSLELAKKHGDRRGEQYLGLSVFFANSGSGSACGHYLEKAFEFGSPEVRAECIRLSKAVEFHDLTERFSR